MRPEDSADHPAASPGAAPHALIVAGTGRYGDPWHPFAATAGLLAEILEEAGWLTTVNTDPDDALAHIGDADLIVVDAGDPWRNGEARNGADPAAATGLADAVTRGIGVLSVHNSLSSLRDYPLWHVLLGGGWEVGRSGHPPLGPLLVELVQEHPVMKGLDGFVVEDEAYVNLAVGDVTVLAVHRLDGVAHPLVWVTEHDACRVVVSALGHDERSFASREHRRLLQQAAAWAARRD